MLDFSKNFFIVIIFLSSLNYMLNISYSFYNNNKDHLCCFCQKWDLVCCKLYKKRKEKQGINDIFYVFDKIDMNH